MKYYLGIDQGTSRTTSIIFNDQWEICAKGYTKNTQYYPRPGWVEHNPIELWEKTKMSVSIALKKSGIKSTDLRAVGLDNQGETCLVWNKKTGIPIYNAIVWQDRRTATSADNVRKSYGTIITQKTGVKVDAYFSALKIKWILDNVRDAWEQAEKGELMAGTLDSWLIWRLTGGQIHMTDPSTASRTMLFNLQTQQWDDEILDIIGIPKSILPEIHDSATIYGHTSKNDFFDAEIPIAGSVVDQAAALFGQACFQDGSIKTTYGTGCFMLLNTKHKPIYSKKGLITTVVWKIDKKLTFALDGGVYISGAAVQWLKDGIQIIDSPAETEALARSVPDTGGVYFVPAFVGLAAPYWDQYARGTMIGITGGTTRVHIVRATLEAIAFQVAENLDAMQEDSGLSIDVMRVDGGAVVNEFLMQFQADILGVPIDVPVVTETTALGAAQLAALGIGDINNLDELSNTWKLFKRYEPTISNDKRQSLMAQWKRAVDRSRKWAEA